MTQEAAETKPAATKATAKKTPPGTRRKAIPFTITITP